MNLQEHQSSKYELYGFHLSEAESEDVLGTTYKAVEQSSKDPVAVQVFTQLLGKDPVLIEALDDYALQISGLIHNNIQRVISFQNGESGCILVKEYIEGMRLDGYLQAREALDWQVALRFIKQILQGLTHAHEAGFVHQNISTNNIFITRGNTAKITDFGLAQIIKENSYLSEEEWKHVTPSGYAAPEVLSVEFAVANKASDIYSVGLIAYEMLTGIRPNEPADDKYSIQVNSYDPIDPLLLDKKGVPDSLSHVIQKATELNTAHRYPDAASMLLEIEELSSASMNPSMVVYRKKRRRRRSHKHFPAVLIAIGALLAILSASFFLLQQKKQNPFLVLQNGDVELPLPGNAQGITPATTPANALLIPASDSSDVDSTIVLQPPLHDEQSGQGLEDDASLPQIRAGGPESTNNAPQAPEPQILHTLIIRSNPSGATTSVNGKEMGITPFHLSNITGDKIDVELSLAGHKELRQEIFLETDRTTETFFNLIPANNHLVLTVWPWGNIYLDDMLIAERVSGTDTLMISPGQSTLSVVHPSFGSWEKQLDLSTESDLTYTVDFRKRASLSLTAFDDQQQSIAGEVVVDGKNMNVVTPLTIELPLGKHTIEVHAPGFEPFILTTTIDLENGQPEPLKLQLRRK